MNRLLKNNTFKVLLLTSLVLVFAIGAALTLKIILWESPVKPFFNGVLIFAVVLFTVSRSPFCGYLAKLPRIYAAIFSLFLFLFVGAQLLSEARTTYPFVSWSMFTSTVRDETVQYHQYLATTESGEQFLMRPARIVRVIRDGRFINRLEQLSRGLSLAEPPKVPEKTYQEGEPIYKKWTDDLRRIFYDPTHRHARYDPEELEMLLNAFANVYNLKNSGDPITGIQVIRNNEYFLEPYPWKIKREVIYEIQMGERGVS